MSDLEDDANDLEPEAPEPPTDWLAWSVATLLLALGLVSGIAGVYLLLSPQVTAGAICLLAAGVAWGALLACLTLAR